MPHFVIVLLAIIALADLVIPIVVNFVCRARYGGYRFWKLQSGLNWRIGNWLEITWCATFIPVAIAVAIDTRSTFWYIFCGLVVLSLAIQIYTCLTMRPLKRDAPLVFLNDPKHCPLCLYSFKGRTNMKRCPDCGWRIPDPPYAR